MGPRARPAALPGAAPVEELARRRGVVLRRWEPRKLAELADWRHHVVTPPYSETVAIRWGQLQARAVRRGRPRPANDT